MKRIFVWYLALSVVYSHPQCLDFDPPFVPSKPLQFCSNYKKYTCCTSGNDTDLDTKYHDVFAAFNQANFNECSRYVRDILCAKCDPFAAHIFEAENKPNNPLKFPGLCNDYCEQFFVHCRETIPQLTTDTKLIDAHNASTFCRLVSLTDKDYCYPNLIKNQNLANLTERHSANTDGCLCVQKVAENLRNPTWGTFTKDQSNRFYVLEQIGIIRIYADNWKLLPQIFLDIQDRVYVTARLADERGLLGLAFHPNYDKNRKFYIYYTANNDSRTVVRISEFKAFSNGLQGDSSSERIMIELPKPNNWANHNGGMIMFGIDGLLYAFIGDGGGGGDWFSNGQNKSVLFGKAIRLDVNLPDKSNEIFRIPSSNPFTKVQKAAPEIFAYGLRNAWRCSVDRGNAVTGEGRGRIFCGDVGQDAYEEIDIVELGKNYGWRGKEGFVCYDKKLCGSLTGDTLPIHAYSHAEGKSVTGGYVYRGCKNPNLKGSYIYGDYVNGQLFRLKQTDQGTWENKKIDMCEKSLCTNDMQNSYDRNILSFAEDFKGELYMLVTSTPSSQIREGKIYRLIDPRRREDPTSCKYPPPV